MSRFRDRIAAALRSTFRQGYGREHLKADVLAGIVVGIVALPLSMALAIASGVAPQHGLYTAIVGGFLIALLGGSRVQVSGPTAAFVVILAPVATRFGVGGLLLAGAIAGIILILMGASGLGRMIQYIPGPVVIGFTAGIAVVIATLQLKDLLGLTAGPMPETYLEKVGVLAHALPTWHPADLGVGLATLVLLVLLPRWVRRVPVPLLALAAGAGIAYALERVMPGLEIATISRRFSYTASGLTLPGIPRQPPSLLLPWHLPGAQGAPIVLSFQLLRELLPSAFAIAMLGAIESLLSAVVADGMTGDRHDPDAELVAQGIGNLVVPAFGGIAATGAIARTATNIRSGARSPIASMTHAAFVLLAVVSLAPLLGYLPMAALAALLLVVAWNMSESHHFVRLLRGAPRGDVLVLLTCFLLTVIFDMTVSVTAGVVLAALLFMRRMAQVSEVSAVAPIGDERDGHVRGLVVYEIAGPLFFGAAQKALDVLQQMERRHVRIVVLKMEGVPILDATGLMALENLVADLNRTGIKVVLAGVQPEPLRAFTRAGWRNRARRLRIFRSAPRALEFARRRIAEDAASA
jgi:sulfate permease, SulP family